MATTILSAWYLHARTDAEAEAVLPWLPDMQSQLIGKDSDAEKHWRQQEKGAAENEVVR